jgi:hypothetical protein
VHRTKGYAEIRSGSPVGDPTADGVAGLWSPGQKGDGGAQQSIAGGLGADATEHGFERGLD